MKSISAIISFLMLFFICSQSYGITSFPTNYGTGEAIIYWDDIEVKGHFSIYESYSSSQTLVSQSWIYPPNPIYDLDEQYGQGEDGITFTYSKSEIITRDGGAFALASTEDLTINSNAQARSNTFNISYLGESRSLRTVGIHVPFITKFEMEIPYSLAIETSTTNGIVAGYSRVWSYFSKYSNGNWVSVGYIEDILDNYNDCGNYENEIEDIFTISYTLMPGNYQIDIGTDTRISATTTSPVPLPSSILILGVGVVSLFFTNKKK